MIHQIINDEKFTNIQSAQAGLTKIFESAKRSSSFYRVLKNDQPLGVLVPNAMWQSLVEDLEALSSPSFKAKIERARREPKSIKAGEVKRQLGL